MPKSKRYTTTQITRVKEGHETRAERVARMKREQAITGTTPVPRGKRQALARQATKKGGLSSAAKTAAIATGKVRAPAGSMGLRVLQEVMTKKRKKR